MSDAKDPAFDPYYKWLGIPKVHRPPTHYQLLGLALGESDAEVIDEAAIRQSTHLRTYQLGPHAAECTRILNEIALAKQTLLNPQKKKAYDQQIAPKAAVAPPVRQEAPQSAFATLTPVPRAKRRAEAFDDDDDLDAPRKKKSKRSRPKSIWTSGVIAGVAGGGVLAVALVVILIVAMTRSAPALPPPQVVRNNNPPVAPPVIPVRVDPPVRPVDPPVRPVDPPVKPVNPPVNPPVKPVNPPINPVNNPAKKPGGDPGLDFEGPINLLDFRHFNGFWESTDPVDPTITYQLYYRNLRSTANHFRMTTLKNNKVINYENYANLAQEDDGVSLEWVPDPEFDPTGKSVPARLTFEWDRIVDRRAGLVRKFKRADARYNFVGTGLNGAFENAKFSMHLNGPHDPIGRCTVELVDKKGSAWLSGVGYGDSMRFDLQFDGDLGAPWDKVRKMVITPAPPMAMCEFSGPGIAPMTAPVQRSNGQPMFPDVKERPKTPDHRGDPGFPGLAGYWQATDANDPTIGYQIYYRHPPGEKSLVWLSYLRNGKGTGFAVGDREYYMMGPEFRFNWSHHRHPDFAVQGHVPTRLKDENNALSEHPYGGAAPRKFQRITDFEPYRPFWGKWLAKSEGDSIELAMKLTGRPGEPFDGSLKITTAAGKTATLPAKGLRPFGDQLQFDFTANAAAEDLGEPWDCMRDVLVRRHGDALVVDFISREGMILRTKFRNAAAPEAKEAPIIKKSDGPGWVPLGESDFVNVNTEAATWKWTGDQVLCSGEPTGVCRTKKMYKNFELELEWRHLKAGGKSGITLWTPSGSLQFMKPGKEGLPSGVRIEILDPGAIQQFEQQNRRKPDTFTAHGDIFGASGVRMTPFPPTSPDGTRSFPKKRLTKGVNQWNHYFISAVGGEVRLSVNGEEVSGGSGAQPAHGPVCLQSEGSPIEFRNLRIRELP